MSPRRRSRLSRFNTCSAPIGRWEAARVATYEAGGKYKWNFSPTAEISEDVRFTGVFDQPNDWRAVNVVAIVARLNSMFSLKASNSIRYTNAPLAPFKSTDTNTAIALVAKF